MFQHDNSTLYLHTRFLNILHTTTNRFSGKICLLGVKQFKMFMLTYVCDTVLVLASLLLLHSPSLAGLSVLSLGSPCGFTRSSDPRVVKAL